MSDILSQVGEDLATMVREKNLPTTELDIDNPKIGEKYRFIDGILAWLVTPFNSHIFVGDSLDYTNAYINALALLMGDKEKFRREFHVHSIRSGGDPEERFSKYHKRLIGKRLHTLQVEQLLSLGHDYENWKELFSKLLEEAREKDYFLVIDDLPTLLQADRGELIIGRWGHFIFSVKLRQLTFITGLTWPDFANGVEQVNPGLLRFSQAMLFSSRPPDLPLTPIEWLMPDPSFTFEG